MTVTVFTFALFNLMSERLSSSKSGSEEATYRIIDEEAEAKALTGQQKDTDTSGYR